MKPESDSLRLLKILFSREYSTRRAIELLYDFHLGHLLDGMTVTTEDEEELLKEEEEADKYFFCEAVDWEIVRPTLEGMLQDLWKRDPSPDLLNLLK